MKKTNERKTTIDPAHSTSEGKMHDRDQLRHRLLKMILQNEALRRSTELGRSKAAAGMPATSNLAVFDPEDLIGREIAASLIPQKPA
jgi:hypothetical protein